MDRVIVDDRHAGGLRHQLEAAVDAGEFARSLSRTVEVDAGAHRHRERTQRVGDVVPAGKAQRDRAQLRAVQGGGEVVPAQVVDA